MFMVNFQAFTNIQSHDSYSFNYNIDTFKRIKKIIFYDITKQGIFFLIIRNKERKFEIGIVNFNKNE